MTNSSKIQSNVSNYYTKKINDFGKTPQGVDWNSAETQEIRFVQLSKLISKDSFSVLDFGCGYGSYYSFLKLNYLNFNYTGYDISESMRVAAKESLSGTNDTKIVDENGLVQFYDFVVASGIFNVKLDNAIGDWVEYTKETLMELNRLALTGFSFNMLTSYSDRHLMKDYLYYPDPMKYFDFCKQNFSRNVALLHDYDLYEFTLIVRKES